MGGGEPHTIENPDTNFYTPPFHHAPYPHLPFIFVVWSPPAFVVWIGGQLGGYGMVGCVDEWLDDYVFGVLWFVEPVGWVLLLTILPM